MDNLQTLSEQIIKFLQNKSFTFTHYQKGLSRIRVHTNCKFVKTEINDKELEIYYLFNNKEHCIKIYSIYNIFTHPHQIHIVDYEFGLSIAFTLTDQSCEWC